MRFLDAFAAQKPPPCERFACPRKEECASQLLACESFVYYITNNKAVNPLMLFEVRKTGLKVLSEFKPDQNPTRELYDQCFKDQEDKPCKNDVPTLPKQQQNWASMMLPKPSEP